MTGGHQFAVACLDVGAPENLGWAILSESNLLHGSDPREMVSKLAQEIEDQPVALGFECPLYVPLRSDEKLLTRQRKGECGVCWSGGPGGGVLPSGIVQTRWVLAELVRQRPKLRGTTRWDEFRRGECELLIWEAFIASSLKLPSSPSLEAYPTSLGKPHERDAIAGVLVASSRFATHLPPQSDLTEDRGISLVGMHLLATGLASDTGLLNETCLVVATRKPT